MDKRADLHLHSNYSDGMLTLEELLRKCVSAGLRAVSITDHDTIDGCGEAEFLSKENGIEFINGVEFSCHYHKKEYHIIGYCLDLRNEKLKSHLDYFRVARFNRGKVIVGKLNGLGLKISFDDVVSLAGKAPISRPHIALVMVQKGFAQNYKDAFHKYIGDGCPAYQAKINFPYNKCINLITECGGVSFLAHPGSSIEQKALYNMINDGLDGIETVHPSHSDGQVTFYRSLAQQYLLLESGGTDYHGSRDNDEDNFGKYTVPYSYVKSIKLRARKR